MATSSPADATKIILVVEDEPVLRASMSRGLSKLSGVEVVDAGTVRDAKQLLRALETSVLVTDVSLPDGSGVELVAEMDATGRRAPIIFVSAYISELRSELPVRQDIIVQEKPVSIARLRALVESLVGAPSAAAGSPFSVSDYVQLAAMGRRSVELNVRRQGNLQGKLVIRAGEAWSAHDLHGSGRDAFVRLVLQRDVSVTCRVPEHEQAERNVQGTAEELLLNAARAQDEGHIPGPSEDAAPSSELPAAGFRDDARPHDAHQHAFKQQFDRGVDALLEKNYGTAYDAFAEAARFCPEDTRVIANLRRLRELGFGADHD